MISIFLPDNSNSLFDILTLIISSLAIVVSIVAAWYSFKSNEHINNINLNSIYHNKIFDDIILEKLPRAIDKIKFRNGVLEDDGDLEGVLGELKKKIMFYKYKNKNFYRDLYELIIEIDDKVALANNDELNTNNFFRMKRDIELKTDELYKIIGNEYIGKKRENK